MLAAVLHCAERRRCAEPMPRRVGFVANSRESPENPRDVGAPEPGVARFRRAPRSLINPSESPPNPVARLIVGYGWLR